MSQPESPREQIRALSEGAADPPSKNAYVLSLELTDVRCFDGTQTLDLSAERGGPARWTLILGENGVGKTTLLQLLYLLSPHPVATGQAMLSLPRWFTSRWGEADRFARRESAASWRAEVRICWSESFAPRAASLVDSGGVRGASFPSSGMAFDSVATAFVHGYGANRRQAPPGLTNDGTLSGTLFDDNATLRNPEEWLLQTELVASKESARQQAAQKQLQRVKSVLTRVLPGIDDVRTATRENGRGEVRVVAEVHGPDGWIPFSGLGLGYRTMTAWMVDFASRLFERYPDLDDPLTGAAVCLVDEIDLHLHPRWQRDLVEHLTTLFPNTQFIATAHSPLIVQAAKDANLVVLKREGDRVVIDNHPPAVRKWRLDQILTSDLFGLVSARPRELDAAIEERDAILAKPELSGADESRLAELRSVLADLPSGDTPEDIEAMDVIRRAARALQPHVG